MKSTEEGLRRRRKSQGGHEILEAALTMALFFGFMFLIMDISMAGFVKGSLLHRKIGGPEFQGLHKYGQAPLLGYRTVLRSRC
jgi:hypothetical protein